MWRPVALPGGAPPRATPTWLGINILVFHGRLIIPLHELRCGVGLRTVAFPPARFDNFAEIPSQSLNHDASPGLNPDIPLFGPNPNHVLLWS